MKNYGICNLSAIPVRKSPGSIYEMVTQILFGEIFSVVKHEKKWTKIINEFDNYVGWVNNTQIRFINDKEYNFLSSKKKIYSIDKFGYVLNNKYEKIYLPLGCSINSCEFLETKYIGEKSKKINSSVANTVKLYLNTPYLWGGKTNYGIDCSGFSQQVYKLHGININRDASQQALQGKIVKNKNSSEGDLAFFGESKKSITHVGILLKNKKIIHAYGKIRIDKINNRGILNLETKKITHKLVEIRSY